MLKAPMSIDAIRWQMAEIKLEDKSSEKLDGALQLKSIRERRARLRTMMKNDEERVGKLTDELGKLADRSWLSMLWGSLWDDSEKEMRADARRLAAELERTQNELHKLRYASQQVFEKLQNKQDDVKRTSEVLDELARDLQEPLEKM